MNWIEYFEKENEESLKRIEENSKRVKELHEAFVRAIR